MVAALLGWIVLDQRLNGLQLLGALIVLISVVLGQPAAVDRLSRRRSPLRISPVSGSPESDRLRPERRWPRQVYAVGNEPDPRFTFANERTFLAWIRTALGFLAAGVAIAAVARLAGALGPGGPRSPRSC